jgi:outer membrane lipase/esterase
MSKIRWTRSACVITLAALAAGTQDVAAQFSNTYFFGDSLTDNGSYKPVLPPGTGLFTTNPGPIWAQLVANRYGGSAVPADQGGTDYAEGGARVTQLPGVPDQPPTGSAMPISTQIATFLAQGPVSSTALYSVWGGANDIFYNLGALQAGAITEAQLQTNVATAAVQLVQQVGVLQAAGAHYIMVWNIPDIGATPFGQASGSPASITAITSLYNSTMNGALNQLGGNVIRLNVFGFLDEVIANPAAYGILNTTIPACGTTSSLVCTSANLVAPNAATTFLFADAVHPTTAGHMALAEYAESFIEGPSQMLVLAEAPLAVEAANFRAVDARMQSGVNSPYRDNKFQAWAYYDYSAPDFSSGFVDDSSNMNTISVGGDMKLSDELLVGLQFGYTENRGDFGNNSGGYKLDESMGTVYLGWGRGPWWLGATAFAGDLQYTDVHRDIQLLAQNRVEQGTTSGSQYGARLLGGYWFKAGDWLHGPFVNTAWQNVTVQAFSENGSDSTALSYGQQSRYSWETGLGWQVSGQLGSVRPFARATWQYEARNDARSISATPVDLGGTYTVGSYQPDNNWVLFNVGASMDFGKITGYIGASATAARSDGNGYSVTVGIKAPL